jgi:hypothetical protein
MDSGCLLKTNFSLKDGCILFSNLLDFNKISITYNNCSVLYRDSRCLFFNLFFLSSEDCFTGLSQHAIGFAAFCAGVLFTDRFQSELLVWQFPGSVF